MEEKTLVSSKRFSSLWVSVSILILGLLILLFSMLCPSIEHYYKCIEHYNEHKHDRYCAMDSNHPGWDCLYGQFDTAEEFGYDQFRAVHEDIFTDDSNWGFPAWSWGCLVFLASLILSITVYFWFRCYEITVTDKRVYGHAGFGRRVDLPVDSISAIGTMWLKGIAISTSSGRVAFLMIKNRDEIHKCMSDLLIERQSKVAAPIATVKQETPQSNADELKKYKELLDMDVITQEEFDAKKKQLLNL